MESNNPVGHGGRRYGAENIAQIAATYNQNLDSMEESLLQAIRDTYSYGGPANNTSAPVLLIYTVVRKVRQKLILEIGRQDMDPRFQPAYALIAVALGCVGCSLLIYILLGDIPGLILVLCILMLIIPSLFETED